MMIPDERVKREQWVKWAEEIDEGLAKYPPMGLVYLARQFPIPNTEGMSPAEAEATLAAWRAEVNAFTAAAEGQPVTPSALAAQPAGAPEVPAA